MLGWHRLRGFEAAGHHALRPYTRPLAVHPWYGVMYLVAGITTASAEVDQAGRIIDTRRTAPYGIGGASQGLRLLDLNDDRPMRSDEFRSLAHRENKTVCDV